MLLHYQERLHDIRRLVEHINENSYSRQVQDLIGQRFAAATAASVVQVLFEHHTQSLLNGAQGCSREKAARCSSRSRARSVSKRLTIEALQNFNGAAHSSSPIPDLSQEDLLENVMGKIYAMLTGCRYMGKPGRDVIAADCKSGLIDWDPRRDPLRATCDGPSVDGAEPISRQR